MVNRKVERKLRRRVDQGLIVAKPSRQLRRVKALSSRSLQLRKIPSHYSSTQESRICLVLD